MMVRTGEWICFLLYLGSWLLEFSWVKQRLKRSPGLPWRLLQAGLALQAILWLYSVLVPGAAFGLVTTLLDLVAWLVLMGALVFRDRWQGGFGNAVILPFVLVLLMIAGFIEAERVPAVEMMRSEPFLRQAMLVTHIVTLIAGHIFFAVACASSVLFLHQEHQIKTKLVKVVMTRAPSLGKLYQVSHQAMLTGFIFLTVGLGLGVILGGGLGPQIDVRLGVSMLVWVMYGFFLIERLLRLYDRRWSAIFSIVGFVLVLLSLMVEVYYLGGATSNIPPG